MALPNFLKKLLGMTDDSEENSLEAIAGFSELYETRPYLSRDLKTLDEIPTDPEERYSTIEEEIRISDMFFQDLSTFIPKLHKLLRKREEEILVESGLEGQYSFETGDVPGFGDVWHYDLPSGIVSVYLMNDKDDVDAAMQRVRDGLACESEALEDWRQELDSHLAMAFQIFSAFATDYAQVTPLSKQNQKYDIALGLCVGGPHSHATYVNLTKGEIVGGEGAPWEKDIVLSERFQADFLASRAGCDYNIYIISHQSDRVGSCTLSELSPQILANYVASLTTH